ncbi:hypothetical protein [Paenibacillus sp. GYB003]|uniref:hypothetical protein n=1 Tax=Paenibacillus sp. GYB003 TaxID=2994392 RepID=UPI002F969BC1
METKPTNGMEPTNVTERNKRTKLWVRLAQPLLIAACLFLWLVFTPMGQLVHFVVWWKTLTVQEANLYCAIFSIAAALVGVALTRRTPKTDG